MAVNNKDIYCQIMCKYDAFHLYIFLFHLFYLSKQIDSHVRKALYFTNKPYE